MLALLYTTRKCEHYQLRMRAISHSKHTKLKSTKIYSKGVLVNHTKISTNENFPLYGKANFRPRSLHFVMLNNMEISADQY